MIVETKIFYLRYRLVGRNQWPTGAGTLVSQPDPGGNYGAEATLMLRVSLRQSVLDKVERIMDKGGRGRTSESNFVILISSHTYQASYSEKLICTCCRLRADIIMH